MLNSHEEIILNGLMNTVADRQQLLSNNLTNVQTKGYVRRDIDFSSVLRDLKKADGSKRIDVDSMISKAMYDDPNAKAPTYEDEMAAMFENQLKYTLLTRINGHIYKHLEEATQAGRAG